MGNQQLKQMEQLTHKINLQVTCPYCQHSENKTFYLNADTLDCNDCGKDFSIELWAKDTEVRSGIIDNK